MVLVVILHDFIISIHALLAESDTGGNAVDHIPVTISIHALLAESDSTKKPRWENRR